MGYLFRKPKGDEEMNFGTTGVLGRFVSLDVQLCVQVIESRPAKNGMIQLVLKYGAERSFTRHAQPRWMDGKLVYVGTLPPPQAVTRNELSAIRDELFGNALTLEEYLMWFAMWTNGIPFATIIYASHT